MIGGRINDIISTDTWIMSYESGSLTLMEGPPLLHARERHACGMIKNELYNIIVTVGGTYYGRSIKSSEILNLDSNIKSWTQGPNLPFNARVIDAKLVQHKTFSLLLIGGIFTSMDNYFEHKILEFDVRKFAWTTVYSQKRNTRLATYAVEIPDNLVKCVNNN